MAVAASAGYSGKPLWQKLGLKVGIEAGAPPRAGRRAVIRS
jgi:hypothetical protein